MSNNARIVVVSLIGLVTLALMCGGTIMLADRVLDRLAPVAPPTAAPSSVDDPTAGSACEAVLDYQLQDLPEVSTGGSFLHVEFWEEGSPEMETVLPTGRYILARPLKGHVWEYSNTCSAAQVKAQVDAHIERRRADKANNAGWADSKLVVELFRPAR